MFSPLCLLYSVEVYALSAPAEELGDYDPHNYTEEGDEKHNFDLAAISIPDTPFDPELDLDLDFRFDTLASICMSISNKKHSVLIPIHTPRCNASYVIIYYYTGPAPSQCLLVHSSSLKILKRQKRDWIIDSFTIREDHKGGFPYELGPVCIYRES
ncbi:hypothetical protein F7725_000933 [Dissostichus mawsoni]|uniref:Uncharacterized protein n=1 Tax=Dissostichus mawsoni TaxID=36200 RepID=A0A7J5ZK07_DISMA|nr:hypothetical protein F7725_000933 [Dissostichus mawsoni]